MRKIIHIDMDCFYAAVEIRDNPNLRGHPVAVGGSADRRGVLCACNYEARKFGLHSAMPTARAIALCPELMLLPVNMEKYRQVSQQIHSVFKQYTEVIEPLALDEAYLDVTESSSHQGSATLLAQAIREDINNQQQLTASAGIAPNKFLAKVASDWRKPNGQFVIPPQNIATFVESLAIEKLPGVGKVTANKLHARGIKTCKQLQQYTEQQLVNDFGIFGSRLCRYCRGIDDREVQPSRVRKSVSVETTFLQDLTNLGDCEKQLSTLYESLLLRLQKYDNRTIHKQFIKIKLSDFSKITRECVVPYLTLDTFIDLLRNFFNTIEKDIRLLGIGVRFHTNEALEAQQTLW